MCQQLQVTKSLKHIILDGNFKEKSKNNEKIVQALINLINNHENLQILSIASKSKHPLRQDIIPFLKVNISIFIFKKY